jgi:GTPase SAR1 family protein
MALKPINNDSIDTIKLLVVGQAGIGKTSTMRTITNSEPDRKVCVLSAESGLLSVRDLIKSGAVEGWEIRSLDDMREAHKNLSTDEVLRHRYG